MTGAAFPAPPDPTPVVTDLVSGVLAGPGQARPVAAGEELKGLFRLDPANCGGAAASGTYFRMIQPGGNPNGPYIENNSSACSDKTYTELKPGKDGGLSTAGYQPHPEPAFDGGGNGMADRITGPQSFFGRRFATATNAKDPQTGKDAPLPKVVHDGAGKLAGDLSAFAAAYSGQHFNQGAPKPDGSTPGLTAGPTGSYDAATRRFTLEWSSTIVGGAFNNFTGRWHFEGVFESAGTRQTESPGGPSPGGGSQGLDLPLPVSPSGSPALAAPSRVTTGAASADLKGLFRVVAASCAGGTPTGSYFRMIQPGGSAANGPFLSNNSSACADKSYTELTPGKDGGLSTVAYQPQPNPPFGSDMGGLADRITLPKEFFGAKFAAATNATDPQTNLPTVLPKVVYDGSGKLSGDTRAFAAAYQGQHFNQGAPKPDGSAPGATTPLSGTYDPATKRFTMEWASTIVGGPFDNFTGKWHFEGTFEPVAGTSPTPAASTSTTGTATSGSSGTTGAVATGGSTQKATQAPSTKRPAVGATMARTGPPWPAALPASLLTLALLGRWLSRRPSGKG